MPNIEHEIPGFPVIHIRYDDRVTPYFEVVVLESLTKLKSTATGNKLLNLIAQSKPSKIPDFPGFPPACRVQIVPTRERLLNPRGAKWDISLTDSKGGIGGFVKTDEQSYNQGFKQSRDSASECQVQDLDVARYGGGIACKVEFNTSVTNKTSHGEWCTHFTILGHELIHALHSLYGIRKNNSTDEENWTTGIMGFEGEEISENRIRADAGVPLRARYF
jgi:hypothetical protein